MIVQRAGGGVPPKNKGHCCRRHSSSSSSSHRAGNHGSSVSCVLGVCLLAQTMRVRSTIRKKPTTKRRLAHTVGQSRILRLSSNILFTFQWVEIADQGPAAAPQPKRPQPGCQRLLLRPRSGPATRATAKKFHLVVASRSHLAAGHSS